MVGSEVFVMMGVGVVYCVDVDGGLMKFLEDFSGG